MSGEVAIAGLFYFVLSPGPAPGSGTSAPLIQGPPDGEAPVAVAAPRTASKTIDIPHPAFGTEVSASTDADGTQVTKVMGRALMHFFNPTEYVGVAVEHAWYSPGQGGGTKEMTRAYVDAAGDLAPGWHWQARIGTDGHTVIGNGEVRREDWSTSLFIERDLVETRQGVDQRLTYTFAGVSHDIISSDRNVVSLTAGVQAFSGSNTRLHLRGSFVHVLDERHGLSVQLRARYYHSSHPGEFDYYSPRDYLRVLPVLQMRRFTESGWMLLGAGGFGATKSTAARWTQARYAELRVESPRHSRRMDVFGQLQYVNDSIVAGPNYDALIGRFGVTFAF